MTATPHPTSHEALQAHLIEREQERCRCLMTEDFDSLRGLLSDQLVHVHTRGNVDGKANYLRFVEQVAQVVSLSRGPLSVRQLAEDVALMTGRQTNQSRGRAAGPSGAVTTTEAQVAQIWKREADGAWRIHLFQGTALPKEQAA